MRTRGGLAYLVSASSVLLFAGILLAQNSPSRALVVNGKSEGIVTQIGGRAYIDVETVARITNGSVTLESNRVVLNFRAAAENEAAIADRSAQPAPPPPGLSRNFSSLAISELAEMREWRGAVGTILTYNVPVVGSWPQDYHDHVDANLRQVALAATTSDDLSAMVLLQNEFSNLSAWADNVVTTRKSLNATNTVRPDTLQSDQALTKISDCGRFLSAMLVRGTFSDDPSCH